MAKKYPKPRPIPQPHLQSGKYSKRQLDRLQYQVRKNASPKAQQRLAAFGGGDLDALVPFDTYPDHTISKNKARPRTVAAGYDYSTHTLRLMFRKGEHTRGDRGGAVYEYYRVPVNAWRHVQKARSEGRYINSTLKNYPYRRIA
ncbi:KTSC domain-containing protein [Streptomyces sp. UNOC14_S4]|uniref:KTSC domain-containing protein n=1 Tax=Streptomyces sp. UNOC14_S4 TaxID=2872340 RepID=UPI001E307B60|nr:KTSC domain-containing protein [Streptomyces sp. UNOC14_S4]MCC3766452.1 KTSC domain-containing protein [Streptomyces sp. UNOC14_S4]